MTDAWPDDSPERQARTEAAARRQRLDRALAHHRVVLARHVGYHHCDRARWEREMDAARDEITAARERLTR